MNIEFTRTLLRTWGHFRRNGWNPGIGWHTENHLYKSPKGEPPEVSEDVLIVHKYIASMERKMSKALTLTYVKNLPYRQAGKKMDMGKDSFAKLLGESEQRVAGYMSGIETRQTA